MRCSRSEKRCLFHLLYLRGPIGDLEDAVRSATGTMIKSCAAGRNDLS